jgi:hypothetical protein
MSKKSHTCKKCGTLGRKYFSTRGYAEIHIQRAFFDNKDSITKIVALGIQMVNTSFGVSSLYRPIFFYK